MSISDTKNSFIDLTSLKKSPAASKKNRKTKVTLTKNDEDDDDSFSSSQESSLTNSPTQTKSSTPSITNSSSPKTDNNNSSSQSLSSNNQDNSNSSSQGLSSNRKVISNSNLIQTKTVSKAIQITGEERVKVAEEIINNFDGSSKFYAYYKLSNRHSDTATEEVYRKILQEYYAKDNISKNWIINMQSTAASFTAAQFETKLKGFVRCFTTYPYFSLMLYLEQQLQCIRSTTYEDRILHYDATGGKCTIPKYQNVDKDNSLNRILTYYCVFQNTRFIGEQQGSFLAAEHTTSSHDVRSQTTFLWSLKFEYEKLFCETLNFRFFVMDFTWTSIHSCLRVFNNETAIEYAHHILSLSKHEIKINKSKTYLVSCVAHTSKRFSKAVTEFCLETNVLIAKDKHRHACLCFSLLLNSRDLQTITTYFKLICTYYLSKYKTDAFILADRQIKDSLDIRPKFNEDLNSIINHSFKSFVEEQAKVLGDNDIISVKNNDDDKSNQKQIDFDEDLTNDSEIEEITTNGKTIRDNSPFTLIFENLYEEIAVKIEQNNENNLDLNSKYNPKILDFILKKYMPYCFIWASFSFQDTNLTRMTNGLGEKHNQFSKSIGTRMAPSNYSNQAITVAKGSSIKYQKDMANINSKKRKPITTQIEDSEDIYTCQETYYKPKSGVTKASTYQSSVIYQDYILPQKKSAKRKSASIFCNGKKDASPNKGKIVLYSRIKFKIIPFY